MNDHHAATWGILLAFLDVGFLTLLGVVLIVALSWSERSVTSRSDGQPVPASYPSAMTLLRRALARRCPVCGRGQMFRSYFAMNERCPSCTLIFWKNEGEWMGPMVMDYTAAGAAALLSWLILSWFELSTLVEFMVAVGFAMVVGLLAVPWSRSLWTVFLYLTEEVGSPGNPGGTPPKPVIK